MSVLFQSLLGWTGRVEHLGMEYFPVAHHSHPNGVLSVLPGETGGDDVSRGEEEGRAGISSPGSLAVTSAVVSMAAF